MNKTGYVVVAVIAIVMLSVCGGWTFTINGTQPGTAGGMTPVACATAAAASKIVSCGSTLNSGGSSTNNTTNTNNVTVCAYGGTVGTDFMYIAFAPVASPCASATPAPNSSTKAGFPIPTGTCQTINFPTSGGGQILSSEIDGSCTASSMTGVFMTLP